AGTEAVWHLFLRAVGKSTALMGTTVLGILFSAIIAVVAASVTPLLKLKQQGFSNVGTELTKTLRESIAGIVVAPVALWLLVVITTVVVIVYQDHKDLLARIRQLNTEKTAITAAAAHELEAAKSELLKANRENGELRAKLDAPEIRVASTRMPR